MINKMNYIMASAGTGKTETLILRIEDLIVNYKIDISNIVLITFTNKSAKEMKDRLREKLFAKWEEGYDVRDQLDKLNMVRISTIHSFCDEILRNYGLYLGIAPNYKISSFSKEMDEIINFVIEQNYNESICSKIPTYIIKDILKSLYKETKDKGVDLSLTESGENTFWGSLRLYLYELYKQLDVEIEKEKRNKNVLTNNDLLHHAAQLVKNKDIAQNLTRQIKYMFVDECQDINNDQMNLFETLMKFTSLTIVGDEKQSIYGFRGSDTKAFKYLVNRMQQEKGEKTISNINYRSNDELIKIFNKIFNSKFYYHRTRLNFDNTPLKGFGRKSLGSGVFNIKFNQDIVDVVENLSLNIANDETICYNNIAILCRTNREVNQVIDILKHKGINAEIYSSKSIYKSRAIIDLYKVLKYLITDGDIEYHELFYTDYFLSTHKYFNENYLKEVLEGLKEELKTHSINYVINRLIESLKIEKFYYSLGKKQYIANINRIKEICRELSEDGLSNIQIIDYINTMIDTQQIEQEPEIKTDAKIVVSTIHTFKGLSADIIILYNADRNLVRNNNVLYQYDSSNSKIGFNKNAIMLNNYSVAEDKIFNEIRDKHIIEILEEEIRLLYVACTRAREKLIILNSTTESKIKYVMKKNPEYVSYTRWILESKL